MGIVNAQQLTIYDDIPKDLLKVVCFLLYCSFPDFFIVGGRSDYE